MPRAEYHADLEAKATLRIQQIAATEGDYHG